MQVGLSYSLTSYSVLTKFYKIKQVFQKAVAAVRVELQWMYEEVAKSVKDGVVNWGFASWM